MRRGNKLNALLNKEWGQKVKKKIKKLTATRRRHQSRKVKKERYDEDN